MAADARVDADATPFPGPGAEEAAAPAAPPEPVFRIGLRALLAFLLTEAGLGLALAALWRAVYGAWLPPALAGYALGTAALGAFAFAAAEAVAQRRGLVRGIGVGLLLAPAVLAGGDYVLYLLATADPLRALEALLGALDRDRLGGLALFASGGAALHAPLLRTRLGGRALPGQVLAMTGGALAWGLAIVALGALWAPLALESLNATLYAVLVAEPRLDGFDDAAARVAYRRAAAAGHPEAMWRYAYRQEWFGPGRDRPEALLWYRRAAEAGHPAAMRKLGWIYRTGWGGAPVDAAAAERWYGEAARRDDLDATLELADWLAAEGRPGDARAWRERARALAARTADAAPTSAGR